VVLKKALLVLFLILLNLPRVLAEEVSAFDLGEIIVTKGTGATSGTPSRTEISSEDIERRNAQSVDKALDFVPGVRLTVGQKNEPYVMIRGFDQDKALVLLDGIPIASPYYGFVDLDQIPTENISKIKVIKGVVSPLYGANAMGGVVNIVSKEPTEKPYLELQSGLSANNTQFHTLSCSAKTKITSFWLSGGYRESDGFELSRGFEAVRNEDGNRRENSDYTKNSVSLKVGLEKYEKFNMTSFFNYIDNEKGIPPHASGNNPRFWRFTEWKRWMAALAGELELSEDFLIKGRVFYDKYDNTIKAFDDAGYNTQSAGSSWISIYDEYAIGASMYFDLDNSDINSFKGAINFKKDVHKEQDDTGDPWEEYEIRTYSFGLEDELRLGEKLSLIAGASLDYFDQIRTYTNQTGDSIETFNPIFTLNYYLKPETLLYASASKRTRFPTINHLYSNTSGNPNLNEQRNINFEAGTRHVVKDVATVEFSYFYNRVKDLIDRASKNDPFLNISRAIFSGAEAHINANIGKFLLTRASYTYLYARDRNPEVLGRSEEELSYVPAHKADFEAGFTTDFKLSCSLLGSYNGKRYYYDSSNNQHTLGSYFVWNAKIAQGFHKNWEGSVFIENIFDENYQEEEGYPQPGRNFLFNLKATF